MLNIVGRIRDRVITAIRGVPLANVVRVHKVVIDGRPVFSAEYLGRKDGVPFAEFGEGFFSSKVFCSEMPLIDDILELVISTTETEVMFQGYLIASKPDEERVVLRFNRPMLRRGELHYASCWLTSNAGYPLRNEVDRQLKPTAIVLDGYVGGLL